MNHGRAAPVGSEGVRVRAIGAAVLLGLMPVGAYAAGETQPLSSTVDPTAALPKTPSASTPIAPPALPPVPTSQSPADTQAQFVLSSVVFDGASTVSADKLQGAWSDLRGKPVSLMDLRGIARRAEAIYAADGYPFVAIVVTPQSVNDGIVHLKVVEGHISNLTVLSKDPVARRQATAAFEPRVGLKPLSLGEVDSAYQMAKAVPGLAVAGALRRGDEPGGMDLVVQAQRQAWRLYANVNSLYPDATGPWGALLGLDYDGDSAWGDETSGQFYSSLDSGSQYVLRLSHVRRLNSVGTTLSLMTLFAWADPKGVTTPLDIAAGVQLGRIALDQPLYERADFKLDTEGALEVDDQDTKVFHTTGLSKDRLQIVSLSLNGEWKPTFGGDATLSVEARKGIDIVDASKPGDPLLSRPGADPQAFVVQYHGAAETPVFYYLSLAGRLEGQVADHALTAPDQYAIGNLSIGRGYQPGAAYGDSALAGMGELRLGPFPLGNRFQLQPFGFYDAAELWTLTPGAHTRHSIASYGGGLRLDLPGTLHIEVAYGQPIDPAIAGQPTPHGRVLVNITVGINEAYNALFGHGSKGDGQ